MGVTKHRSFRLVALSPCEAELDTINKRAAEAMKTLSLAAGMEISFVFVVKTDSSTAVRVVNRRGVGYSSANSAW